MTNDDAIKWLENLKQDIGQLRHEDLWPYAQAIDEIFELLKEQEAVVRCKDCKHHQENSCEVLIGIYDPDWFCADGERP